MRRAAFRLLGRLLGLKVPIDVPTEDEIEAMIARYYPMPDPLEASRPAATATKEV